MKSCEVSSENSCDLLSEIKNIFTPLSKLDESKIQMFIHGSWADNTRTEFSDLDDFIIVEDGYYRRVLKWLNDIEFKFYKIDPLQHHGHWLVKKSDLQNYDNSYMPLFILSDAVCIFGESKIRAEINPVKSFIGTVQRIKNTCKNIEMFYELYKNDKLNLYDLKRFVGSISLIVPLLFQIKGVEKNKREALNESNLLLSDSSLKMINWATDLRNNWEYLLNDENYFEFKKKVQNFSKATEWRNYAKNNAPVVNSLKMSKTRLIDDLVGDFINEILQHVDKALYRTVDLDFYEKTYKKIEKLAIKNGAVLVGKYGNINHPSISDLDILICFKDKDYKNGCGIMQNAIQSDLEIAYIMPHTPLYVFTSMLPKIKYIHTLTNLNITYSNSIEKQIKDPDDQYIKFLNFVWCFIISRSVFEIEKNNLKYSDIRKLLLFVKNIHTSINNLENMLGLPYSNIIEESKKIRDMVLDKGIISQRKSVENLFIEAKYKLISLLSVYDSRVQFKASGFSIRNYLYFTKHEYVESDSISIKFKGRVVINELNMSYIKLLSDIIYRKNTNAKYYFYGLKFYLKRHYKIGGYINKHVFIIPSELINRFNVLQVLSVYILYIKRKINLIIG